MLKLKKGELANVIEDDTTYDIDQSQPASQLVHDAHQAVAQQPVVHQTVGIQTRPSPSDLEWGELLVRFLAAAPEDVALKLTNCIDINLIVKAFEKRMNDPYLKVALLLLMQKK
jgi:hypothetical protein